MDRAVVHGRQPFGAIVRSQGRTVSGTADFLGFDRAYALRVLCGRVAPSDEFRDALCGLLGLTASELFTASALNATFQFRSNTAARRRQHRGGDAR